MKPEDINAEIERLIETEDEKALENFMIDHFSELPEEDQKDLLFALYTDAVERLAKEAAIMDIQKRGIEVIEKVEAIRNILKQENSSG